MRLDRDAILWSARDSEREHRPLLVLLHGYGSYEGDLFGLSPYLPLEPVVASLRAPLPESGGFAWWSLVGQEPGDPDPAAVDAAARAVVDWLDEVGTASVSLLGFSQGAAVALQVLRLAPTRVRATVALSGFVSTAEHDGDAALASTRPRVFWGRGTADRVITHAAIERTSDWMPHHVDATVRVYEGVAHSISMPELAEVAAFLRG
jgi:phospholipase/carboxylesterase